MTHSFEISITTAEERWARGSDFHGTFFLTHKKRKVRNVVQDLCREIKKAEDRDEQLGPEDVFSPMLPSEALKMLVST